MILEDFLVFSHLVVHQDLGSREVRADYLSKMMMMQITLILLLWMMLIFQIPKLGTSLFLTILSIS